MFIIKKTLLSIICSKKLKYSILLIILFLLFICINAVSYASTAFYNISDNVFRLHVIANSNSKEDQELKYIVRDAILNHVNKISKSANSKKELIENLNLYEIQQIAKETIEKQGYAYNVSVEIGNFSFPTKTYGDISLPAGFYDALRVKIGNAEGKNWWCVMFPPLCFVDITNGIVPEESKNQLKESINEEEYDIISKTENLEINFKFKLIELLQNITTEVATKK